MAKVKMVWKQGVFAELRTLPAVMDILNDTAETMAKRAGKGYAATKAKKTGGRVRGRASVITQTNTATRDQAKNHTLERVITTKAP